MEINIDILLQIHQYLILIYGTLTDSILNLEKFWPLIFFHLVHQ